MPRTSLSALSYFLALPAPHIDLSSLPLSCPGEGLEASHAMPEVVFGYYAAPTGTHEHSLPSSLPSPLLAHHGAHLNCFAVKSLPCCWVEIGQWIQTVLWAADRQADRQHDCESFIFCKESAKNDSLSQGSLSSMPQTKVHKTEWKCSTDSNGYGANSRSTVNFLPYHNLSVWPPANHISFLIFCFFYVKLCQRFGVLPLGEGMTTE